ncbi:MAG: cytochrome c [Meiothermus sp.]|nr:cytochrome c [Meiothermus sp.]
MRKAFKRSIVVGVLATGVALAQVNFTAQQATQGAATYRSQCAMCHGPNLQGASGPALKGQQFAAKW